MLNYKGSQFQTSTNDSYHDSSFVFNEEKGFQMAFGILNPLKPEDKFEEYFQAEVYQYQYDDEGNFSIKFFETHQCSDSELGLDESTTSKFYSKSEQDKKLLE